MIGSLFSGIGGLDLAAERAGLGPVAWQVEIDPFCREVLAKHWPNARRYDDVRTVGAATLAPVDVVVGGFPCQDISLAGRGAGLAGERSGLWFEYLRILGEMRPRGVIVENVDGLARRGLDVVAGGLVGLGYAVEVSRVAASDVGAPHRRIRHFILAYADRPVGLEPGRRRGESGPVPACPRAGREELGYTSSERWQGAGRELDGAGLGAAHGAGEEVGVGLAYTDREGQPQQGGAVGLQRGRAGDGGRVADANGTEPEESQHERAPDELTPAPRGICFGAGASQPRVGGGADGLPAGLDGAGPGGAWPAGRGEAQHPWEPPRTQARVKNRPARLKALGNAVCPQQGFVAALRLRDLMGVG